MILSMTTAGKTPLMDRLLELAQKARVSPTNPREMWPFFGEVNATCLGCSGDLFRCGPRWMVEAGAVVLPPRLLIGAFCEVRRFTVG